VARDEDFGFEQRVEVVEERVGGAGGEPRAGAGDR
jgi:hypothetical protein